MRRIYDFVVDLATSTVIVKSRLGKKKETSYTFRPVSNGRVDCRVKALQAQKNAADCSPDCASAIFPVEAQAELMLRGVELALQTKGAATLST